MFLSQAMEEDFHPSYDCSDCAKAAGEAPENGNKKKQKMSLGCGSAAWDGDGSIKFNWYKHIYYTRIIYV